MIDINQLVSRLNFRSRPFSIRNINIINRLKICGNNWCSFSQCEEIICKNWNMIFLVLDNERLNDLSDDSSRKVFFFPVKELDHFHVQSAEERFIFGLKLYVKLHRINF